MDRRRSTTDHSAPRPPLHWRLRPPAILVLLSAGCGAASPADETAPVVFTDADLQVLATSDSLAVVEDLEVLADGTVRVLNSVEPLFLTFDAEGRLLDAGGRRGGGPEEYGGPAGFVASPGEDVAWTFDRRRHALIRLPGPPGSPMGTGGDRAERMDTPLPRDVFPPGSVSGGMNLMDSRVRTARLGREVVLPRRLETGDVSATAFWTTIWNAELVALDPETGRARPIVSLPEAMGDLEARFEGLSGGFPPFPLWYRLWTVCDDEVRLHDFTLNQLRGFTADGTELEPIDLPPPPFTEATPRQFARASFDLAVAEVAGAVTRATTEMSAADSARILDGVVARLDGTPQQLAGLLPQYVNLRCGDDGTLWLRPLDLERGGMRGGPGWVRIAPDGHAREVRFPDRFDPFRFTDGRAWGVLRDALDVPSLAWVAL